MVATPAASSHYSNLQRNPPRFIPASKKADKITKGLCYYCDKPYRRGHKCANRNIQLFLVEVPGLDFEEVMVEDDGAEWKGEELGSSDSTSCILVIALNGDHGFQTMEVTRFYGKKALYILIDSGSTHNFLDTRLARKLGCRLESIGSQVITVDGGK